MDKGTIQTPLTKIKLEENYTVGSRKDIWPGEKDGRDELRPAQQHIQQLDEYAFKMPASPFLNTDM